MPTLATILMLQAGLHSFVLAIVSSLRLCSCSRVNQAYLLLGPNIIGQQVIYYNRAARLEYSWLSFKELRWSNLPNHNFTHYMAELVIRSIRKTIHSDWLPSRAISFSYRPEIGVDLKTNKPYSRRFYKRFTEKKKFLINLVCSVCSAQDSICPRFFFHTDIAPDLLGQYENPKQTASRTDLTSG